MTMEAEASWLACMTVSPSYAASLYSVQVSSMDKGDDYRG